MLVFLNLTHYHCEHNNTYEVPAKHHKRVYRITVVCYVPICGLSAVKLIALLDK